MIYDANGYVICGGGNIVDDYGADSAASDNHTEISNAIASDYRVIIIPTATNPFLISQPLDMASNKTVVLQGDVKITDGGSYDLLADFTTPDTTVDVTDAETYFSAGQQVTVSDDNRPVQGGGAGQTRREGDAFVIQSVSGTTITLDKAPEESYTTAANAKIGHTQSVFLCENLSNVKFTGNGCIDDNRANQYDVEPVGASGEDVTHGCAVSFYNCENIEIENIELKNSVLHNITLHHVDGFVIDGINSHLAHDKSILFLGDNPNYTENGTITNSSFNYSVYEDGLSFYSLARNISVINCETLYNGRNGLLANSTIYTISISGLTNNNCGSAALIRSPSINFTGTNMFDSDGMYKNNSTKIYTVRMEDNATYLKNVNLTGGDDGFGVLSMTNIYDGLLQNVVLRDTIGSPNEGFGLYAISDIATTLTLLNVTFSNLKDDREIGANITVIE